MVGAGHPSCCLTGCLNRRQEKGDQHPDNRNDYQKLDESEGGIASSQALAY